MHPPESPRVRYLVNKDDYSEIKIHGPSVTGPFHAEYNLWEVEKVPSFPSGSNGRRGNSQRRVLCDYGSIVGQANERRPGELR